MPNNIQSYILDFAQYEEEPLYVVLGALIHQGVCSTAQEAIAPLLSLTREGYIEWYHHPGWDTDTLKKVNDMSEIALAEYVAVHEPQDFQKYPLPDEGGEYYIKLTPKGQELLESLAASG